METAELFQRLGLALAIGLLIGVERGWREREGGDGSRTAGIRTYALIGLLGGVWGAMVPALGTWPLAISGLGLAGAFAAFQWREGVAREDFSVTSVIAGLLSYALGAFAVLGNMSVAVAAGVAVTALLAARQNLHEFLRRLTWPELRSAILLLAMTFLLLPILPDRSIDPWGALNPHQLWLFGVLIAVLSFVGYVSVRVMGPRRGVATAAAAGALVSSTAVTLTNSQAVASAKGSANMFAAAICIAWMVSLARMSAVALVVNTALLVPLSAPMLSAIAVLGLAALYFYRRDGTNPKDNGLILSNPFELSTVLGFGALLGVVLIAAKFLSSAVGGIGLLALAGVSGTVDVDPVTLSAARLAGSSVTVYIAALAILVAAAANMTTKIVIAIVVGGTRFGLPLVVAGVLAAAAGGAAWLTFAGLDG